MIMKPFLFSVSQLQSWDKMLKFQKIHKYLMMKNHLKTDQPLIAGLLYSQLDMTWWPAQDESELSMLINKCISYHLNKQILIKHFHKVLSIIISMITKLFEQFKLNCMKRLEILRKNINITILKTDNYLHFSY